MGNERWQNYKGRYLKMGKKLQFTELDQYLFGQGTHYDIYRKLGAHPREGHLRVAKPEDPPSSSLPLGHALFINV